MKHQTTIWTTLLASVCYCLLLYACTGGQEELERLNADSQNAGSRATEPVTATVTLTQAGTLDAQLTAALGSNKFSVQSLIISGPFNASDVECLHKLAVLEKLDMSGVNIIHDDMYSFYAFTYSYGDNYGNTYNFNVSEYLSDNEISNYMFAGMPSLKEVIIPQTVTATRTNIFRDCTSLMSISLPSSLKEIGYESLRGCTSLKSLTIPEGVEKIDQWALADLQLSSIQLPNTLKEIGNYAFNGSSLTEITLPESVTTLGYGVFSSCRLLKLLTIPAKVTQVDGQQTEGCNNLQALIWNTSADVPGYSPNGNCFLYINSSNGITAAYDANNWPNTIVNGEAESIRLTFANNGENTFSYSCPIAFNAKSISLTMHFYDRWTYEGKASGWRTITLPFKVTSINSEQKGALAPFGSDIEGTKPFWLRSLTDKGFVDATSIDANKPYIIAMPYNPNVYLDEYNISGNVTFTGENVEIAPTPNALPAAEGPEYYLQPTYQYVKRGGLIYALNYDYSIRDHEFGSVFARSSANIYPYEAYVKPKSGSDTRALYEINTRSANTRSAGRTNTTGVPAIGDM